MAVKPRRRIKVQNASPAKQPRNEHPQFAGGISYDVIGHTKDVAGLTGLERMEKGIYGLFDDYNPNYSVVYGSIQSRNALKVVEPVYPYRDLLKVFHSSTILRQCVDSYVTNIESYGIELEYVGPEGQEDGRAAQNEKARIERLITSLTTDGRPLKRHREDSRVDKEVLGARAFEVIQDAMGRVVHMD